MSKRRPDVQLTRDNFERESDDDSPDECTEPIKIASQDVLKTRPMVKAKRRLADGDGTNGTTSSIFSGFKNTFGSTNTTGKFNFGSFNSTSAAPTPTFGLALSVPSFSATSKSLTTTIASNKSENKETLNTNHTDNIKSLSNATDESKANGDGYSGNLSKLNKDFYDHVKKYMESASSTVYDFSVVCQEYIEQCKKIKETKPQPVKKETSEIAPPKSSGLFKFGDIKGSDLNANFKLPQSTFTFGQSLSSVPTFGAPATTDSKPQFSFGASASGSLFATSTPLPTKFTLPTTSKEETAEEGVGAGGDGEDETPPKVLSIEHSETDAVYSKKCKLYYQKNGSYVDKGLGFLYIKVKDDAKPQLLIRADTTTGNILLNIALIESLPVIKADKGKGVMLTCIPNPEIEPKKDEKGVNGEDKKTVTFLIRVKASDNDELYDSIVKYKSQS